MICSENRVKSFTILAALSLLLAIGCSSPSGGDDDDNNETVTYELSVNASPSEGGSVNPDNGTYDEGEEVEVTATAADGWEFVGWSGDQTSGDNPLTFTINEDTEVTAEFEEVEATTYELTVNTNPEEGGTVDPESETFEEGTEIEIEATPADGWKFDSWSGDISSDDNPLTFTINEDVDLTAQFEESAKAYSGEIEVDDGSESTTLVFGMDANATSGFDSGIDDEAPPAPPEGSFYAHLAIEGYNLFKDYRPVTRDRTVWEVQFDTGEDSISLNWNLDASDYVGSLTLADNLDNPSITIDMETESSYEVSDSSVNTLFIIQQ